jgi:hypothetical protein
MSVLQERNKRAEEILQGKFITRKLEETSKEIDKLQRKGMSDFRSSFWNNRSFSVSNGQLTYKHDKRHRFVDMKNRMRKDGTKNRKKSRAIHNKIIWGQYNYLTRELAYGYTEAVKSEIQNLPNL